MKLRKLHVLLLVVSLLAACGGGGGGGGGSASGSTKRPGTGIRVLHASIDSAPVDLFAAGKERSLSTTRFAGAHSYVSLQPGSYSLTLSEAQFSSAIVGSAELSLAKGDVRTLLLYGDRLALGVKTSVLDDAIPELSEGQSAVRFVNAAVGAKFIEATAGGAPLSASLSFGSASEYLVVPSGSVAVAVRRAADGRSLLGAIREFASRKAYSILVTGQVGYFVTTPTYEDN